MADVHEPSVRRREKNSAHLTPRLKYRFVRRAPRTFERARLFTPRRISDGQPSGPRNCFRPYVFTNRRIGALFSFFRTLFQTLVYNVNDSDRRSRGEQSSYDG